MSGHHSKNSKQMHAPLKTMLGKIGNRYQTYCTVYKMHTVATYHGCMGYPTDKDINLQVEDPEAIGMDNNNESISGLDAIVALGGLEAEDNPDGLLPSNQPKLTALTKEWNELHQWVGGQRRTTSQKPRPHRMRATKSLSSTSTTTAPNANTCGALQRSDILIDQYIVYHTKADKPS